MLPFATFLFDQLPPPPCRVLEVGCGRHGGFVDQLAAAGYDVLGVDPDAPEGQRFHRAEFQEVDGEWDAAVAGNVLHHVEPLDASLEHLARLAPLLVVDEFASNRIDPAAQEWYEDQHRVLSASGIEPRGMASVDEWRERHSGLHPDSLLLAALRARWDERVLERGPWLYRWLRGPNSEELEQSLIDAGAIPAIGYRWVGKRSRVLRTRSRG